MLGRAFGHLLLALALLVCQQFAATHAYSHHHDEPDAPAHSCHLCLTSAQLGAAPPSTPLVAAASSGGLAPTLHAESVHQPALLLPFHSRAPPAPL